VQVVNSGRFNQTGGSISGLGLDFSSNVATTHYLNGGTGTNLGAAWGGSGTWVFRVTSGNTVKVNGDWAATFRSFNTPEFIVASGGLLDFRQTWTGSLGNAAFAGNAGW